MYMHIATLDLHILYVYMYMYLKNCDQISGSDHKQTDDKIGKIDKKYYLEDTEYQKVT